jgi:AraC family transcriptional regulator
VSDIAWVESLQKAIEYMEEHLFDDITVESIAHQANASTFHFQRTFSILTDITVADYLRQRRLTLAAEELIRTDNKIIDFAYKYGYDTPEAFSKAFRKQHGVSPRDARKGLGKLQSYNRLSIQVSLKGADPMNYRIVERDGFEVVGIKREFQLGHSEENIVGIPKFWDEVNTDGTCDLLSTLINGELKGILGLCVDTSDLESKVMDYWVAVEHKGDVPKQFERLEIPTSKWAVFEVHGAMPHAMQDAWKKIFSEWFPSSGYKHAGTPDLEVYTGGNPSSPDYYSEIWIPVK